MLIMQVIKCGGMLVTPVITDIIKSHLVSVGYDKHLVGGASHNQFGERGQWNSIGI